MMLLYEQIHVRVVWIIIKRFADFIYRFGPEGTVRKLKEIKQAAPKTQQKQTIKDKVKSFLS